MLNFFHHQDSKTLRNFVATESTEFAGIQSAGVLGTGLAPNVVCPQALRLRPQELTLFCKLTE